VMIEAIRSFEASVPTRATRRHILEDGILPSRHRENHILHSINRLGCVAETWRVSC
jgi:hypothetical protein